MDGNAALKKYQAEEAARVRSYANKTGMQTPEKYASGGGVKDKKGGTTINIVVGKDQQQPNPMAAMALANALKPKAPPVTVAPPSQPVQSNPMPQIGAPGLGGIAAGALPGMKKGGRATAIPMTAGAGSGPGRDLKSDSQAKRVGEAEPSLVMPKRKKA